MLNFISTKTHQMSLSEFRGQSKGRDFTIIELHGQYIYHLRQNQLFSHYTTLNQQQHD